ncbi:carbohydrate ABC transporter permease [Pelagovum pacificum]|uniref:Maltose/maltodextrin transport system permease protein MalG n=1 Tax=Pelagovum pacificum TaxID=2588711 RepID=A0A5C5GAJ3_9RHOB|nr:carbohydrate ABC transporter permease [Pelagovum pacificum]QQA41716.1 carbohydrate ABC transporter permease [Pelagovum pacificum]TNY30992.1 carbohydrate ABC transporter permease [Pelagovum pacificum]
MTDITDHDLAPADAPRERRKPRRRIEKVLRHLFGITISAIFLAPLAWALLASLKPTTEARQPPIPPWPTTGFSTDSYEVLGTVGSGLWTHAMNSVIVSVATVALSIVVSFFAGYGFSRFSFPFKNLLFVLIISTIMIPFQSILTPLFLLLSKIGLQNSLFGLILIYTTLQLPFSVFMMRNAFDGIPKELEEAARVDGAGVFTVLIRVMAPLVLPGLVTVAIFAFLAAWNEFLAALVLMTDQDNYTLPILIAAVRSGNFGAVDWGAVQAGVTVMMVPCLILFITLQRYYLRGLTAGAVK